MATKTLKFLGMAFGTGPVTVTATANGTEIFSGTVTAVNQPVPALPNTDLIAQQIELFTTQIDTSFSGQIPMTCSVSGGSVIFGRVTANYVGVQNPVYLPAQIATLENPSSTLAEKVAIYTAVASPAFSAEEIAQLEDPATPVSTFNQILGTHNCSLIVSSGSTGFGPVDSTDARSNVYLDGVLQAPEHGDLPGTWWWIVGSGSTLSYNLDVAPSQV